MEGGRLGQGAAEDRRLGRQPVPRGRLPRRAGLGGAPFRLHRAGRGADAVLRQRRRLCRGRHHGRHLGHGRLLRADRQQMPHLRRRRDRRRAGAAAGRPRGDRGRVLHRRPVRSGGGRDRRAGQRAVDGRVPRRLDQDRRPRHRRGVRRPGPAVLRCRAGQPAGQAACRTARRARRSTARSSSSGWMRRPGPRPRSTTCCGIRQARARPGGPDPGADPLPVRHPGRRRRAGRGGGGGVRTRLHRAPAGVRRHAQPVCPPRGSRARIYASPAIPTWCRPARRPGRRTRSGPSCGTAPCSAAAPAT